MITVLVIEADPAVRLAVRRVLEPAGFTLIVVADASVALARLAVVRADLVICDIDALASDCSPATNAIADAAPSRDHLLARRNVPNPQRVIDAPGGRQLAVG